MLSTHKYGVTALILLFNQNHSHSGSYLNEMIVIRVWDDCHSRTGCTAKSVDPGMTILLSAPVAG